MTSKKTRVAIVGGGLAGLSAAEALARDHAERLDVKVFEAKRLTGGRASSFVDPSSGETFDYCQHVAMGCCTNLIGLLDRCGQLDHWNRHTELEFRHVGLPLDSSIATFRSIRSSAITGVHLWFDREITDRPHAALVVGLSQWLFRPNEGPGADESYYQVVISASRDLRGKPKDALVREVVEELKRLFSDARDAKLIRSRVVTDPKSVFSARPELEAIRPNSSTALPWLHLAGDWIATGWPSTMESAVIGGRMAASSLLKQIGHSAVTINPGRPQGLLVKRFIKP